MKKDYHWDQSSEHGAQILVDSDGWMRAVMLFSGTNEDRVIMLGPVGTIMPIQERCGRTKKMKLVIERELRKAGYL